MDATHLARARVFATLGTAIFLVAAPGFVVVLVPWWMTHWHTHAQFAGMSPLRVLGAVLIAAGAAVVLDSFARFAWNGIGTPAPVYPTRHLVVGGFYRYVRNPMYLSLLLILVGQALVFADVRLLAYALCCWLITHLFVVFYEEPTLRRSFGQEYDAYCHRVSRWLPRPASAP